MIDQEYADLRAVMDSRGTMGGQLPGKVIRFIPDSRADAIISLDERIEKAKKAAPYVFAAAAFILGLIL